jgi:magnesium transporter
MASPGPFDAPTAVGERVASVVSGGLKWTDISDPTEADTEALAREYGFHPLDLADCLAGKVTKVEDRGDHMFLLLHFPEQEGGGIIFANRVSMFLGKDYIVTLHPSGLVPVTELFAACKAGEERRQAIMKSSPFVAYELIDDLAGSIFSVLDHVQSELDDIEAVVFDETKSQAKAINHARREIAALGRILFPLRLYIADISKAQKFAKEDLEIYFSDIGHKIRLCSGTVDEMKEVLEIYKDTDFVTSSNRTNTVLSVLTIIFTLTIPATVVSSVYGMNIPLPGGAVMGPTGIFGIYTSMIFTFSVMLIPALLMIWYFRRVGWF